MDKTKTIVRTIFIIYLAIVSLIGLVMSVVASAQLIDTGLKTYVFPAADAPEWLEDCGDPHSRAVPIAVGEDMDAEDKAVVDCEERNHKQWANHRTEKAQDAVRNFALIIVGLPLFLVHFRWFKKEYKGIKKEEVSKK